MAMSLAARFGIAFLPCLLVVALLPIHPRRSMTRAIVDGGGGDLIRYDWSFVGWPALLEDLQYMRPEEAPFATLAGAAAITIIVGASLALGLASLWSLRSTSGRTPTRPR
jgi:hypothetical protein